MSKYSQSSGRSVPEEAKASEIRIYEAQARIEREYAAELARLKLAKGDKGSSGNQKRGKKEGKPVARLVVPPTPAPIESRKPVQQPYSERPREGDRERRAAQSEIVEKIKNAPDDMVSPLLGRIRNDPEYDLALGEFMTRFHDLRTRVVNESKSLGLNRDEAFEWGRSLLSSATKHSIDSKEALGRFQSRPKDLSRLTSPVLGEQVVLVAAIVVADLVRARVARAKNVLPKEVLNGLRAEFSAYTMAAGSVDLKMMKELDPKAISYLGLLSAKIPRVGGGKVSKGGSEGAIQSIGLSLSALDLLSSLSRSIDRILK